MPVNNIGQPYPNLSILPPASSSATLKKQCCPLPPVIMLSGFTLEWALTLDLKATIPANRLTYAAE
jgi:hypothetical protein